MRLSGGILAPAVLAAGCSLVAIEREGRPCDENGRCMAGWECHPTDDVCVPEIVRGCATADAVCAWRTATGDGCAAMGAFLPCADGVDDCRAGCRTCLADGTWSECTEPICTLGQPWSCNRCDHDCRTLVHGAAPVCVLSGGNGRCDYAGACFAGAFDADGDRGNGCECSPSESGVELCDGIDQNCNGVADEPFDLGAECGMGACAGGARECDPGLPTEWRCDTMPSGSRDQSGVEVCDGRDDDCDGQTDEGFACIAGALRPCDAGSGMGTGTETCLAPACVFGACQPRWWNRAWSRRMVIDLDADLVTEELTDFPLLMYLDATRVDTDAFLPDGRDIRLIADDGTTVLDHEIEHWDPVGTSVVWVRVPRVRAAGARTFVVMYYGNPEPAPAGDPAAVWGRYRGVWHLTEEAPGRVTNDLYRDARGVHHGDDRVDVVAKNGLAGLGQGFVQAGDLIAVNDCAGLIGHSAFTVEAWMNTAVDSFAWVVPIALSAPTPRDGSQIQWSLPAGSVLYGLSRQNGADLRIFDREGRPAPHYLAAWNAAGTSAIWVRVPRAGTAELLVLVGNASAPSSSSARAVFDLWEDFDANLLPSIWQLASDDYGLGGGLLTLRHGSLGLANALGFDLRDGYVVSVRAQVTEGGGGYGGVLPEVASARFIAGGNANGDAVAMVMRHAGVSDLGLWAATGASTGYDLIDGTSSGSLALNTWTRFTTIVGPAAVELYANTTRLGGAAAAWSKPLSWISLGAFNGVSTFDNQTTVYDWVLVRKDIPLPTVTVGIPTAAGISSAGNLGLGRSVDQVFATVRDTRVVAATTGGWHHLALTYAAATLRLYVDGVEVAFGSPATAPAAPLADLLLGDGAALTGWIDEVRVSDTLLPPAWLAAQVASMTQLLPIYGEDEARP